LAWRLSGIGAQQSALQRRTIEPADDGLHLLLVGSVDEGEAFGFLGLRIADDLDRVSDQVSEVSQD